MSILDKYLKIQKEVSTMQQTLDKAKGAAEQLQKDMKKSFGCSTLKQAKAKLKEIDKELESLKEQFDKAEKIYLKEKTEHE